MFLLLTGPEALNDAESPVMATGSMVVVRLGTASLNPVLRCQFSQLLVCAEVRGYIEE